MLVYSLPTSTMLRLKWVSLGVALLLLVQWSTPNVDAAEDNMFEEDVVQQRRQSCDPQRLYSCRDYLEQRRDQPSQRCCEELERMSPRCRCPAIQQTVDQSLSSMDSDSQEDVPLNQRRSRSRRRREGRGREEEEEEEVMDRAADLPNTCNVRQPPRHCDIQRHSRYSMTGSSM
uniref:2S seed storage protein n=1 Tax=Pseudotsuga menziesii TaxID=3357 RepID=O64930_PSEMZ|nr:2S seed storage protein precursor [Pseudotsuga menziesii]